MFTMSSGQANVIAVKSCIRHNDHIVIVMPYFEHDRFQVRCASFYHFNVVMWLHFYANVLRSCYVIVVEIVVLQVYNRGAPIMLWPITGAK